MDTLRFLVGSLIGSVLFIASAYGFLAFVQLENNITGWHWTARAVWMGFSMLVLLDMTGDVLKLRARLRRETFRG